MKNTTQQTVNVGDQEALKLHIAPSKPIPKRESTIVMMRPAVVVGAVSPKPTVENTCTVSYKAVMASTFSTIAYNVVVIARNPIPQLTATKHH